MAVADAIDEAAELDVLVVTVTYNSADVIPHLVRSLPEGMAGCTWQLVAADNHSRDDTIEVLKAHAPEATIVEMGRNAGYSAGINAAIAAGGPSRSIMILNPDTRLGPRAVATMFKELDDPAIGIVVPRLLGSDGMLVHTLRREPTILRALGDAVIGAYRAGRFDRWGEMIVDQSRYDSRSTADWAAGPAVLVSRDCSDTCGPWDESFFLYSEETEFCLRARNLGYRLILVPDATAVHLGGESQVSPMLRSLVVVNRIKLYRRTHVAAATAVFWVVSVVRELTRLTRRRPSSREALVTLLSRRRMRNVVQQASGQLPDRQRRKNLAREADS